MSKYAKRRAARMARYSRNYTSTNNYGTTYYNYDNYMVALELIEDAEYRK